MNGAPSIGTSLAIGSPQLLPQLILLLSRTLLLSLTPDLLSLTPNPILRKSPNCVKQLGGRVPIFLFAVLLRSLLSRHIDTYRFFREILPTLPTRGLN